MRDLIKWSVCERNFVKKVSIDFERIGSIRKMAMLRFERLKKNEDEPVSFLVEDYYEVVKELLVVYLLKNGLRSQNHQCLISYFYYRNPNLEYETDLIQEMSFFRNRLGYYGEEVPREFYEEKKEDFDKIIEILLKLIDEN